MNNPRHLSSDRKPVTMTVPAFAFLGALLCFPDLALGRPSVAAKAGVNGATLAENHRVNRYGISGGLAGQVNLLSGTSYALSLQADVLYTPRGAEVVRDGEYLGRSRQHYVDFALAIRPEAELGRISVYALLGASFDVLLHANKESFSGVREDITADLRRFDVALLGGLGAAYRFGRTGSGPLSVHSIVVETRHDRGLVDSDAVNGGFKNRSTSLMLGVSFALGARKNASSTTGKVARSSK